jgi:hypothetical protein
MACRTECDFAMSHRIYEAGGATGTTEWCGFILDVREQMGSVARGVWRGQRALELGVD